MPAESVIVISTRSSGATFSATRVPVWVCGLTRTDHTSDLLSYIDT